MFNASYRVYLFAFLIFCVSSSKNIIIYNEETLVAASFFLFVLFVFHYFGNTLKSALDERGENIKVECQNFLHHKQHFLEELSGEHEKIGQLRGNLFAPNGFHQGNHYPPNAGGGRIPGGHILSTNDSEMRTSAPLTGPAVAGHNGKKSIAIGLVPRPGKTGRKAPSTGRKGVEECHSTFSINCAQVKPQPIHHSGECAAPGKDRVVSPHPPQG